MFTIYSRYITQLGRKVWHLAVIKIVRNSTVIKISTKLSITRCSNHNYAPSEKSMALPPAFEIVLEQRTRVTVGKHFFLIPRSKVCTNFYSLKKNLLLTN